MKKDDYIMQRIKTCEDAREMKVIRELTGLTKEKFEMLYYDELQQAYSSKHNRRNDKTTEISRKRYDWSQYDDAIDYYLTKRMTLREIADKIRVPYSALSGYVRKYKDCSNVVQVRAWK